MFPLATFQRLELHSIKQREDYATVQGDKYCVSRPRRRSSGKVSADNSGTILVTATCLSQALSSEILSVEVAQLITQIICSSDDRG